MESVIKDMQQQSKKMEELKSILQVAEKKLEEMKEKVHQVEEIAGPIKVAINYSCIFNAMPFYDIGNEIKRRQRQEYAPS